MRTHKGWAEMADECISHTRPLTFAPHVIGITSALLAIYTLLEERLPAPKEDA